MKNRFLIICFCLAIGLLFWAGDAVAKRAIKVTSSLDGKALHKAFSTSKNHALVIEINKYQHHPNLKSAVNDATTVAGLFEDKYFFDKENIVLLKNVEATNGRTLNAFLDLAVQRDNTLPFLSAKQLVVAVEHLVCRISDQTPISRFIHGAGDEGGQFFFINRKSHGSGQASGPIAFDPVISPKDGRSLFSQNVKEKPSTVKEAMPAWELDLLKKEIAKRKAEVRGRHGTLIRYGSGVVYDKNTDLEWVAGPDGDTNWYDAKRWVENLKVAGGGWRMPTERELKTLYKKGAGSSNMTPLLHTTGYYVWSGETKGSSLAKCLRFVYWLREGSGAWYEQDDSIRIRGFAVRFRR